MNGVNQLALPAAIVAFLTWAFDYGKLWLANVPGFRQSDDSHAQHFQLVFFGLCLLIIGGFAYFSGAHPATFDGWLEWGRGIVETAVGMAFGGTLLYKKVSNNSGGAAASDPTETQNGLPLDPAQMGA